MNKKRSQFDVNETLDRLESILQEKGIKPIARIDHAAAAKSVDMELRPTQVLIFGNPKIGTPWMQSNQMAALELPMRVLAWESDDGSTWVGYHYPQSIVDNLDLQDVSDATNAMTTVLDALTDKATKG